MSGFRQQPKGFATKAIHVGQEPDQWSSLAVVAPLVCSTTFKQHEPAKPKEFEYGRSGNPSRNVLEKCLAALDNAKYALTFSSGLGAITILSQLLDTGDHIICCDDVYGGTNRLFSKVTKRQGIDVDLADLTDLNALKKLMKPNTKMIWIETPTNPLLKVIDIEAVSKIAHTQPGVIVVTDNTFLSPYFQRPLELGCDISMYSLTKYVNGHSDVIMGSIATNDEGLFKRIRFLQNASGIVPSPFDCYQVNRSLKTLALRMEQHSKGSLLVAKYLEGHPKVVKVLHPGMPSHPNYQLALKQSYGHSGVMSFVLAGGLVESKKFLQELKLFTLAESLGGYESLAELPSLMTHASVPPEQREVLGITDSLIRLSVGLEDPEDLIDDLKHALDATFA